MTLKIYFSNFVFACCLVLGLFACNSDDDNWEPGPAVAEGNVAAYFSASNSVSVITTPEAFAEDPTFILTVKRKVTQGAVSVPIIVEQNEGNMQVPSTVDFADGVAEAELKVNYANLEPYKTFSLALRIDDRFANPYAVQDGVDSYQGTVLISQWQKIAENVKFVFANMYQPVYSDIYHLDGVNLFRIDKFLGSPYDLQFTLDGTAGFKHNDPSTWKGEIYPKNNAYWEEAFWWMVDNTGEEYASWDIDGKMIYYIGFYYATGYSTFSMVDKKLKLTPYVYYTEADATYITVTANWNEE